MEDESSWDLDHHIAVARIGSEARRNLAMRQINKHVYRETNHLISCARRLAKPVIGYCSLRAGDPWRDIVLIAEVQEEANYIRHHKKKIAFLFAPMRHFAGERGEVR
jgi:diketogulonate reductase-like aldo/keto reductase